MNTISQEGPAQSDDAQGHALLTNVNEMADADDDAQGHRLAANVNETADSDDDE
jgi:hypothetical protein